MKRSLVLVALTVLAASSVASAGEDLSRLTIPDEQGAAVKAIKEWLDGRALDCEAKENLLILRRGGRVMNVIPIVSKGNLGRLFVFAKYTPKDEFKGSMEMEALAAKLNKSQTFFQVSIRDDGALWAASNLPFREEITAKVFDSFMDAFSELLKNEILKDEALKLLK